MLLLAWMIAKRLGYIEIEDLKESGDIISPLVNRALGRDLAADVKDPITGELIFKQGQLIGREDISRLADSAVSKLLVRSVLTCQAKRGVCARCYGFDLSKGALVDVGQLLVLLLRNRLVNRVHSLP